MKYRKKPVVIEAHQLTNGNCDQVAEWCNGLLVDAVQPTIQIMTLEGIMTARCGDYIIKGVEGEFYPCAPNIFEKTYDEVDE